MRKKYVLTDEVETNNGRILHRIQAIRDFGNVKKGDLGGFVETEDNLSHDGKCWIYGNSMVFDSAKLYDDATMHGFAAAFNNAHIYNDAIVFYHARVYGNARVSNSAKVFGCATIWGNTHIYGTSEIYGNANIFGYSRVFDHAKVFGCAKVCENADLCSYAVVNNGIIKNAAYITKASDIFVVTPIGSRKDILTFYKTRKGINVTTGCFCDTIEEFEQEVINTHKECNPEIFKIYMMAIDLGKRVLDYEKK